MPSHGSERTGARTFAQAASPAVKTSRVNKRFLEKWVSISVTDDSYLRQMCLLQILHRPRRLLCYIETGSPDFPANCGLRHRHGPAWRQHLLIAAGRNADILLAEQASGQNFCCTVARKLITLINIEPHPGLITGVVELNARDAPDAHPRAFDRRAGFKAADIVECEFERISARERKSVHIAHF